MKKPEPSSPKPAVPSAQDLWLAGLDAFSQATKAATQAASQVATLAASATAPPPSLEGLFEARVAKALGRLGTPTRAEVDALSAQVTHLQAALKTALAALAALEAKPGSKSLAKPVAKKTTAAKSASPARPRRARP